MLSVTSLRVALTLVVPLTVIVPEFVTSPPAVSVRLPTVVTVAKSMAEVSLSRILPVAFADTGPVKSLASGRSIAPPRPSSVTAPAPASCVIVEVWLIPSPVTASAPLPRLHEPIVSGVESTIATLLAPVFVSETDPPNTFVAVVRLIAPAPASNEASPVTLSPAESCVIPTATTSSFPPEVTLPSVIAVASVIAMSFAPLAVADTTPVNSLACVSAIGPPAVNWAAPAVDVWVIVPDCVIAPPAFTESVPVPTLEVPNSMALVSTTLTLFAPLFESETAPVKSFVAEERLIAPAPAETVVAAAAIDPEFCSTPTPPRASELPPVVSDALRFNAPPAVVMLVAPAVVTLAETVRPPVESFTVNAPPVVNPASVPMTLAWSRMAEEVALPVSVAAVIPVEAVWVTAPVMSPWPITTVPLAAVSEPKATVEASPITIAVAELLVVVTPPAIEMALPVAASVTVAAVASTSEPTDCVMPTPVSDVFPVAVMSWLPRASVPVVLIA